MFVTGRFYRMTSAEELAGSREKKNNCTASSQMAPVPFRNIVSVSSEVRQKADYITSGLEFLNILFQDDSNPASNLLEMGSGKKWLCSRENRSGRAEVLIMLSKRTRIASIEICKLSKFTLYT